jgi:hypothetical protein
MESFKLILKILPINDIHNLFILFHKCTLIWIYIFFNFVKLNYILSYDDSFEKTIQSHDLQMKNIYD